MRPCRCGSGLEQRDLIDARGIFCSFVCNRCEADIRRCFRPEIFTDPKYPMDVSDDE